MNQIEQVTAFESVFWHDARFMRCALVVDPVDFTSMFLIEMSALRAANQRDRFNLRLTLRSLTSFVLTGNAMHLTENCPAGNVSDGQISLDSEGALNICLFLADGYFQATCRRVEIEREEPIQAM